MITTERGRIVRSGAGGFLCPPGHPMHSFSVETDLRRRPENRGMMALDSAVEAEWLDAHTRAVAKRILDDWQAHRLPIEDPQVQDWIAQVLGYYKDCYRGRGPEPECWHADKLRILRDHSNQKVADHAGVHLIREYYPEYVPSDDDLARAYWGKRA